MTTSEDFIHWTPWRYIQIDQQKPWRYHLYTNSCHPYYRAPYYLMFPKRFLPDRKFQQAWSHDGWSDVTFLASRDGVHFPQPPTGSRCVSAARAGREELARAVDSCGAACGKYRTRRDVAVFGTELPHRFRTHPPVYPAGGWLCFALCAF